MIDPVSSVAPAAIQVTPAAASPIPVVASGAAPSSAQNAPIAAQPVPTGPSDLNLTVTLNTATHITQVKIVDTVTGELLLEIPDPTSASAYSSAKTGTPAGSVQDIVG